MSYYNMNTGHQKGGKFTQISLILTHNFLLFFCIIYTPDEDVRFILCAPSFGAAGLVPRPFTAARGFALVVGWGAAMAAHGSSSSTAPLVFKFKGFEIVLGAGAAMEPHKSSSSFLIALAVFFGLKLVAKK